MRAHDLKEKIDAGEPIRILDIREKSETANGMPIPGAEHMPIGEVLSRVVSGNLPRGKIVCVCDDGYKSGILAQALRGRGFDAEPLEGGIAQWNQMPR